MAPIRSSGNAASTPPGVRPPVQARSRKALQKVLAAAEEVLAADGFDEFTMTAVAERAGVSVGAIYRRFDSKEQLLAAVKDRLLSRLEEDLAERLSTADPSLTTINVGRFHEGAIRALSSCATQRVWNLMIDLVVQTGIYPATSSSLANFMVQGERRYWVHVAVDRYTGQVVDKFIENVKE